KAGMPEEDGLPGPRGMPGPPSQHGKPGIRGEKIFYFGYFCLHQAII
ncbi:unnamed protein product, partial [Cercopithifilaria johnstoni]